MTCVAFIRNRKTLSRILPFLGAVRCSFRKFLHSRLLACVTGRLPLFTVVDSQVRVLFEATFLFASGSLVRDAKHASVCASRETFISSQAHPSHLSTASACGSNGRLRFCLAKPRRIHPSIALHSAASFAVHRRALNDKAMFLHHSLASKLTLFRNISSPLTCVSLCFCWLLIRRHLFST